MEMLIEKIIFSQLKKKVVENYLFSVESAVDVNMIFQIATTFLKRSYIFLSCQIEYDAS